MVNDRVALVSKVTTVATVVLTAPVTVYTAEDVAYQERVYTEHGIYERAWGATTDQEVETDQWLRDSRQARRAWYRPDGARVYLDDAELAALATVYRVCKAIREGQVTLGG